ncbi:MAG: hypothetical protein WCI55_06215 [Armatimonadota bacterium]
MSWLYRNKLVFIIGLPLLSCGLSPFPFGCGLIYSIGDTLRGHPQMPHGTQPPSYVGLWIRDEFVQFDFVGQSFYLMSDGKFVGIAGMTRRCWHFDNSHLFVDSVSLCGNCYQGNVTTKYTTQFIDSDQLLITNQNKNAEKGISGHYRRFKITAALKSNLNRLKESPDEDKSFKARSVLYAIEGFENLSNQI